MILKVLCFYSTCRSILRSCTVVICSSRAVSPRARARLQLGLIASSSATRREAFMHSLMG